MNTSNSAYISKPPPGKPPGRRVERTGGRKSPRRSRTDRVPSITGTPQSLLLSNGKLLRKHSGVLRLRPANAIGRSFLPSQLWDRSYVVVDRGTICLKPLKAQEDVNGSVMMTTVKQELKEGRSATEMNLHSLADIEDIQYKRRGDKVFKMNIRIPDQQQSSEASASSESLLRRRSISRPSLSGAAAALSRTIGRQPKKPPPGGVVTLALRANTGEEAEDWLKQILREVLSNAVMVEHMADSLSKTETNADACEALFVRAAALYRLALGPHSEMLAQLLAKHAAWLRRVGQSEDAAALAEEAREARRPALEASASKPGGAFAQRGPAQLQTALGGIREVVRLQYLADESERQARLVMEESRRSKILNEAAIGDQQRLATEARANAKRALAAEAELRRVQEHARELEERLKRDREQARVKSAQPGGAAELQEAIHSSEEELLALRSQRETLVRTITHEGSQVEEKHKSIKTLLGNLGEGQSGEEELEFIHMVDSPTFVDEVDLSSDEGDVEVLLDDGSDEFEADLPATSLVREKSFLSKGLSKLSRSLSVRINLARRYSTPVHEQNEPGFKDMARSLSSLSARFARGSRARTSTTATRPNLPSDVSEDSLVDSDGNAIVVHQPLDDDGRAMETKEEPEADCTPVAAEKPQSASGCYLVFSSNDQGSLQIHWSHTPVENALAFFHPNKRVPGFKFRQNAGRAQLISGFLGGVGRKRYYNGWVQFIKLSRDYHSELTILDEKGCEFFYLDSEFRVHTIFPNRPLDVTVIQAICVIPPQTEVYYGVQTMNMNLFTVQGNKLGVAELTLDS